MTLDKALNNEFEIYASYGDSTIYIDKHGGVYIMRELSNGKTDYCWYNSYEYARKKHPLDKLNWHVMEN